MSEINPGVLIAGLYKSLTEGEQPRKMQHWHASSIAQCPRAQFYARTGVPRLSSPTGAKILRWQSGHVIEGVIRPHLQKQFPNLISNVRFTNKEMDLTGEIDNYDPDSKAIIEIKSVSHHAVKYRKVTDDRHHLRDEKPYLHHEYQQACYVRLMRDTDTLWDTQEDLGSGEVEQIIYLYITLDGLLVPYSTPVKSDVLQAVMKRLSILQEAWTNQTLPPCICHQQDHPLYNGVMRWCDYNQSTGCCDEQLWIQFKSLKEG